MGYGGADDGQGPYHLSDLDHFQVELGPQTLGI